MQFSFHFVHHESAQLGHSMLYMYLLVSGLQASFVIHQARPEVGMFLQAQGLSSKGVFARRRYLFLFFFLCVYREYMYVVSICLD